MSSTRGQRAYMLHSFAYRETSLIIDVFSREHGRLSLIAKGARRPRSAMRGVLMAFQPLELDWSGKNELQILMRAEWLGGVPLLSGNALLCGYYANELLAGLLHRGESHTRLFDAYEMLMQQLGQRPQTMLYEDMLRRFELTLLQEIGYGLNLTHDDMGAVIVAEACYVYALEQGAILLNHAGGPTPTQNISATDCVRIRGQTLIDLARNHLSCETSRTEAKTLMRTLFNFYRQGKPLLTRQIFQELREL